MTKQYFLQQIAALTGHLWAVMDELTATQAEVKKRDARIAELEKKPQRKAK